FAADLPVDGRCARRLEWDRDRPAPWTGGGDYRACAGAADAGSAGSSGPHCLSAPQPRRIGSHAAADGGTAARARRRAAEITHRLAGTAKTADRGIGKAIRRYAKAL